MKWYSTAEHTPLLSTCCVLVAVYNEISQSISLWLAEWQDVWLDWDHKEEIEDADRKVMYFCYPDPIPEAYDALIKRYGEKTNV